MSSSATSGTLSRADRVGVVVLVGVGLVLAAITVVGAVIRLAETLGGGPIQVFAEFAGTPAEAPIGVDGAPVTVALDTAILSVSDLPFASVISLVVQQLILVTAVVVVAAMLGLLALGILRGVVFSKRHTIYVGTASTAAFFGIVLYPFFGNMAANGAFAALSDGTFENVILTVQPLTFIVAAFVAALATTVFSVGARLQRETEGLV
ncbi:hypothetical protein [Microbacterium sp. NPDC077184]|uniref:hypothetical protein n=1 Tax=Microbacterium sp. NPDC077184 TaxID=3154764 RepID=UPI00342145AC